MILLMDVGNTQTVAGVYKGDDLVKYWRLASDPERTSDEFAVLLKNLMAADDIKFEMINGAVISCVVPPMISTMDDLCKNYFNIKPLHVGPGIKTGMPILYDNPREVGADRVVNGVGAFEKYKSACIVVDFGTATTFDYISPHGEYMGGAIAPGLRISCEALYLRAAKLPRVDLVRPNLVVGKDTVTSMQSGIINGYVGLVDYIVKSMKDEVKTNPKVIATGGVAPLIASESRTIEEIDELLTIRGLKIIYLRNRPMS
jgi:type III pantothenate kinase